jgi:hypothetical protein
MNDSGDEEARSGIDGLRLSYGFFLFLSNGLCENSSQPSTMKMIASTVMAT